MSKQQDEVISFKASEDFKTFLKKQADKKEVGVGTLIKAVLFKYFNFKEKEKELV